MSHVDSLQASLALPQPPLDLTGEYAHDELSFASFRAAIIGRASYVKALAERQLTQAAALPEQTE